MIRTLKAADLARWALVGRGKGTEGAVTLRTLRRGPTASSPRPVLSVFGWPWSQRLCTWVWEEQGRPLALAVGRAREGQCAWEVAHLWTCGAPSSALVELLERVSASAGHAGGRRVFLRLRDTSPIIEKARQAGFQLVAQETLYRSSSQLVAPACGTSPPGLRPRHPGDGPALFRLYLASAPRRVVCAYGLTFEEWRHALENTGERPHEWVLETAGVLQVWLRLWHHPTGSLLCALALPTVPGLAQGIGMALQTRSRDRPVLALVPDYQPQLGAALEETGFSAEATYSTLVKPLAVSAREVAFAPAAT